MISIGEFSKICSVSTKTLRYYDEINLIKPVYINDETGYRYYDISQLEAMLTICRLKSYELPLDDIAEIMKDGSKELLLRKMLQKENELKQKMDQYGLLVENMKKDIDNLKKGVKIMSYLDNLEVKLIEQKPLNILFTRQEMSVDDYGKYIGRLFEHIAKEKLTMTGGPMAVYHDKEFDPEKTDMEIAIPVKEAVKGTRDFAPGLCAVIRHEGPYSELTGCYAKVVEWIEKNDYAITAPPYDIYITDPKTSDPIKQITEIHFPVKKK